MKTGISLLDFFTIAVCAWTKVRTEGPGLLSVNFLKPLENHLRPGAIDAFLKLTSIQNYELKEVSVVGTQKNFYGQYFEQSPFKRNPFYCVNGYYCWFFPTMVDDLLVDWPYDYLKREGGEKYSEAFGETFECYIKKTIEACGHSNLSEKVIGETLGSNQKISDFLLPFPNGNIIIEAKAIEAKDRVRENPTDITLNNNYRDSIVKAVAQAINVWNSIHLDVFDACSSKNNFIIIVTYKELYLGNGKDVWEEFLLKAVEQNYPEINLSSFDPKHLFFSTLYDLEKLLVNYEPKANTMIDKLSDIIEEYEDYKTRKYTFSMYLEGLEKKSSAFVLDNYEELFSYLGTILPKN